MNTTHTIDAHDVQQGLAALKEKGYVVFENAMGDEDLRHFLSEYDRIMAHERDHPFDPGDGPPSGDDDEMAEYLADAYKIDEDELARVLKRIRHTRAQNHGTPWPVPAEPAGPLVSVQNAFNDVPIHLFEASVKIGTVFFPERDYPPFL